MAEDPKPRLRSDSPHAESMLPLPVEHKQTHGDDQGSPTRRRLTWLAVLLAVAAVGWNFRDDFSKRLQMFKPLPAESPREAKPVGLFALGRLEPLGETAAVAGPDGAGNARIETLNVKVGDRVKKGDVLAVLDSQRRLLAERDVAERKVTQAQVGLDQTQIAVASTQAELRANLRSAEASLATAKLMLKRRERLVKSNSLSQEELDQSHMEYETAEQKVAQIQAQLARYADGPNGEPLDVHVAREEVVVAEALKVEAEARLAQAYVRAPFDGLVLDLHLRPGEQMGQGPLLELGAVDVMMARLEVYESDVRRLKPGQSVRLTSPALERPLLGELEQIAALVKRQSVVDAEPAANTDARVVEVLVRLDEESSLRAARFVGLQVRGEFAP